MNASGIFKAVAFSGLVLAVSGCSGVRDFTGQDTTQERREISVLDCQNRGGVVVVDPRSGNQICRVTNVSPDAAGAGAAAAAASSSAGGAIGTGAVVAGLAIVSLFAIASSSSGTN